MGAQLLILGNSGQSQEIRQDSITAYRYWMKWFGSLACVATVTCASAQEPGGQPQITADDIRRFLENESGELSEIAKALMGNGDTNRLFYFPTRDEPATPAKWKFRYDDVNFESADGTKLHGWFLKVKEGKPKGTVVFSHGNAGSIGHHLGFVMWLAEAGYQVLMYDYRGFGRSEGEVDRKGMVEDVQAAFNYVSKRPDVDADRLVSYGHSLGGAKSVTAIAEANPKGVKAIIIDGAFASYREMATHIGGQFGAKMISDELSPKDFIKKITKIPLLVIHGTQDEVVPLAQGKKLFDLANEPKTLFEVKEGRHGDSLSRDAGVYRKRMLKWLDEVI